MRFQRFAFFFFFQFIIGKLLLGVNWVFLTLVLFVSDDAWLCGLRCGADGPLHAPA